jgi:hypothetical protein
MATRSEHLTKDLENIYPEIMTKIKFELSEKPSKAEKKLKGNQDLSQLKQGGSLNGQMLGWKDVKFW